MIGLAKNPDGSENKLTDQAVLTLCPQHQVIRDALALTDSQVHRMLLLSGMRRERARRLARLALGLSQRIEFYTRRDVLRLQALGRVPEIPYCTVDLTGHFRIVTGLTGAALTALQTEINDALNLMEAPNGVRTVTVE
jgi:hypothetical protein